LSLPDDFSKGVILVVKSPRELAARHDLKRGFVFSRRPAARQNAARQSIGLERKRPRGQRVLDGLSGVRAGRRAQAAFNMASFEKGI
jgi:hypothetical protein